MGGIQREGMDKDSGKGVEALYGRRIKDKIPMCTHYIVFTMMSGHKYNNILGTLSS